MGLLALGLVVQAVSTRDVRAEEALPRQLQGVTIQEQLGKRVDLTRRYRDHQGREVALGKYFGDGKPVLLTLNYYRCATLCSLQLNALVEGLRGLDWKPGENFRIVTLSIDPREQPELARDKRRSYLEALDLGEETDWTFLVGDDEDIRAVAGTVGFGYRYDPEQDQYAHPAAIFFLAPDGKVARYLYGIDYPSRDVKFALIEASEGRVGSPVEKLILSCFHYDASIGAYGPFAFGIMRIGGILTVLLLGIFLAVHWSRDRLRQRTEGAT